MTVLNIKTFFVISVLVLSISMMGQNSAFATDLIGDVPNLSISMPDNSIIMTPTVYVSGTATDNLQISSLTWSMDNGSISVIPGIIPGMSIMWSFIIPDLSNGL